MSDQEMQVFVDELAADSVILGLRAWVKTEEYWATKWRLNEKSSLPLMNRELKFRFLSWTCILNKVYAGKTL